MAIINSKKEKLSMPEVITHAVANEDKEHRLPKGVTLQAAILAITKELTMKSAEHTQIGNTVFIAHYSDDRKEVFMRALNVDTARNYLDNSIEFTKHLMRAKVERMVSDFNGSAPMHIFNTIAHEDFAKNWGMKIFKMENGGHRAYVVMKD